MIADHRWPLAGSNVVISVSAFGTLADGSTPSQCLSRCRRASGRGPGVIRVLMADNHAPVRRAFAALVDSDDDMQVVAEASTGQEAVERALATLPHVVRWTSGCPCPTGSPPPGGSAKVLAARHQGAGADDLRTAGRRCAVRTAGSKRVDVGRGRDGPSEVLFGRHLGAGSQRVGSTRPSPGSPNGWGVVEHREHAFLAEGHRVLIADLHRFDAHGRAGHELGQQRRVGGAPGLLFGVPSAVDHGRTSATRTSAVRSKTVPWVGLSYSVPSTSARTVYLRPVGRSRTSAAGPSSTAAASLTSDCIRVPGATPSSRRAISR